MQFSKPSSSFSNRRAHNVVPPYTNFPLRIAARPAIRPARQIAHVHTFGHINIHEVMNPENKYNTHKQLVARQKVVLDNFWSLRNQPPTRNPIPYSRANISKKAFLRQEKAPLRHHAEANCLD